MCGCVFCQGEEGEWATAWAVLLIMKRGGGGRWSEWQKSSRFRSLEVSTSATPNFLYLVITFSSWSIRSESKWLNTCDESNTNWQLEEKISFINPMAIPVTGYHIRFRRSASGELPLNGSSSRRHSEKTPSKLQTWHIRAGLSMQMHSQMQTFQNVGKKLQGN